MLFSPLEKYKKLQSLFPFEKYIQFISKNISERSSNKNSMKNQKMNIDGSFNYQEMQREFDSSQFNGISPNLSANMNPLTAPPAPQSPNQTGCLSNEDFDSLNKAVQLLRISQLRYIVQKFQIPASGNKSKLLNLVLSIFQSLRYDKVLVEILKEINNLLAQQRDVFSNPLASVGHLEICQYDPNYKEPPNPLNVQADPPFILGPIMVPAGQSSGQFNFMHSTTGQVNICFMFEGGNPQQFLFQADLNGYPCEISFDDPYPQPIDITNILNLSNMPNTLNIKKINTASQFMICVREYKFKGLHDIVNQISGRMINLREESPLVVSGTCNHPAPFNLVSFLSRAFGTGNWNCPICGNLVDLGQITIVGGTNEHKMMQQPMPQMQNQMNFPFSNHMNGQIPPQMQPLMNPNMNPQMNFSMNPQMNPQMQQSMISMQQQQMNTQMPTMNSMQQQFPSQFPMNQQPQMPQMQMQTPTMQMQPQQMQPSPQNPNQMPNQSQLGQFPQQQNAQNQNQNSNQNQQSQNQSQNHQNLNQQSLNQSQNQQSQSQQSQNQNQNQSQQNNTGQNQQTNDIFPQTPDLFGTFDWDTF
ncbi:hypothetical protein TRFO_03448 [Tritrichomonas foetus]|uniref:SAP domain-containing protein n=1 Tax=Tritrichomonas foetus TaxID=1144522 RepID=A0A1J4KP75_9EUKA|nr:hypothetical protein TRFO_03448 [Tritrichomonas foetus]|eukprot:OHT13035.1 hypothetical protein TRFO_03448 [Tritrichomonas foetus]